jgi:hypothetical protein
VYLHGTLTFTHFLLCEGGKASTTNNIVKPTPRIALLKRTAVGTKINGYIKIIRS